MSQKNKLGVHYPNTIRERLLSAPPLVMVDSFLPLYKRQIDITNMFVEEKNSHTAVAKLYHNYIHAFCSINKGLTIFASVSDWQFF